MQPFDIVRKASWVFVAVLALMIGAAASVYGQAAGTSSIVGTVMDPKGLPIPGAQVIVRNLDTGGERRLTTNEAGLYSAAYLQSGRYDIRASKEGFAEVVRQGVVLEIGKALTLDFDLPIKAAVATITVTGETTLVETEKSEVSLSIGQTQVENLPLNGRRWDNLVLLTPGVSEDGGFGGVSFRGISSLYNNNQVDGADNNQAFFSEARGRTRLPYGYSLDAIKEFSVTSAVYSAEFGRAVGGVVNAITKSGTNEYHGDFFYFIRDDLWLARDPVANASGQPKPDERRQQFGGSFGGPIIRDRLFMFLNYDRQKRNFPAVITPFDPTFFDPNAANSQAQNCLRNATPAFATACQNTLAALNPLNNAINPRNGDNHIGLAKIDYEWNSTNRISGVFNILRWNSPNGILTGPVLTSSFLANGTDGVDNEFMNVTWYSVIRPTVVNEARFQYGRDFEFQSPNASGPTINITGSASFGMPNFLPRGAFPNEKRFQWVDNLSWVRGRHQFKAGLDINHVRDNIQNLFQGGGVYSYTGTTALRNFVTDLTTANVRNYTSLTQAVDPITGSGRGFFTTNDLNFYMQDNLKLRPGFTVNLGVRYEVQKMPDVVQANPRVPETAVLNTDTNNFGPRVGFSWDIRGKQKQVLRGGYGLYYGRTQNSSIFVHLFQNGIFQQTFRVVPSSCGAPTVPNTLFPQPDTAPAFTPIFGTSGPTPTARFSGLPAFLAACPTAGGTAVVDVLDPKFVNPAVHQYDLAYERELPWGLSASVSYVGSRGLHLPVFVDANLPPPDQTATYLIFDGSGSALAPTTVTVPFFSGAVPRPRTGVGVVLMGKSVINSWYNGLVLRVRRRFSGGFTFDANFTWSQARDNGQVAGVNGTFAGTVSPLNPFNLRGEYGISEIDIRKRFIINYYWVAPFGKWTQNEVLKKLIGGWKFSGVTRVQDGRPVTAGMSGFPTCSTGDGGLTCGAVDGNGNSVSGRVPFIERNTLFLTPGLVDFDFRVTREFKITERSTFEFMWEAFNLFNRTNPVPSSGIFSVQNNDFDFIRPNSSIFGTTTTCPATVAGTPSYRGCLAQRLPPHVTGGSAFLAIRSTGNTLFTARQMQFGARFRF